MSIDTKLQNFTYYAVNVDNNSAVVPVVNYKNGDETVDFSHYAMAQDGDFYVYVPRPAIDPETVMVNLTLYTDFNINFFTTAAVKGVYHKGAPIEAENYEDGKKYVVEGISPDTAADDIDLIFVIEVDGKDYYLRLTYSVLKYSKTVVKAGSEVSLAGKQLVSAAMEYIKSAYAYTGKTVPEFDGVEVKPSVNNAEAVTYLTDAIKSVQMVLDEGFRLRFNIKPEYSGKLTVGSTTYDVVNGQVGELTYVEVEVRAYKLVDSITVSDGTHTASYGLANYAKSSVVSSDAKLKAMVDALYTFSVYASEYKMSNPNLD
jgi:predicted heme/steroid binding protein